MIRLQINLAVQHIQYLNYWDKNWGEIISLFFLFNHFGFPPLPPFCLLPPSCLCPPLTQPCTLLGAVGFPVTVSSSSPPPHSSPRFQYFKYHTSTIYLIHLQFDMFILYMHHWAVLHYFPNCSKTQNNCIVLHHFGCICKLMVKATSASDSLMSLHQTIIRYSQYWSE